MHRRPASEPWRGRLASTAVALAVVATGCGGDDGDALAEGRACRIGERMTIALLSGDVERATDEVHRLDDLDGAEARFDLDAIAEIVDEDGPSGADDLVELFDDAGCDPEAGLVPPTATTASTPTGDTTPFTLPIPTTGVEPPTTTSSPEPPATTATTPTTTTDPRRRPSGTIEVDVGGIDSRRLPAGRGETPAEVAATYETIGMIVPAAPAAVINTYVNRGITYGSTYDSVTSVVATELSLARIAERFQAAITHTGRYEFGEAVTATEGSEAFSAQPVGDGPTWEVEVLRSSVDESLVEIRVSQSDFGDDIGRTIPSALARTLSAQLDAIDELGWAPESVGELSSNVGNSSYSSASVSLTVAASEPLIPAEELAARLEDASVEERDDEVWVRTPSGDWQFSHFGGDDVFVYFSTPG